jgi:hypothetical protein
MGAELRPNRGDWIEFVELATGRVLASARQGRRCLEAVDAAPGYALRVRKAGKNACQRRRSKAK